MGRPYAGSAIPVLFSFLLAASVPIGAVDGIAISTAFRQTKPLNRELTPERQIAPAGRQGNVIGPGKIVRMVISDNSVASVDTIYQETFARYPTLNFNGTKVAFFRYQAKLENDQLTGADKPAMLSVMDTDGSNVQDIVTLGTEYGYHCSIDWPVGDWIYYQKLNSYEIWKVKYNDPSTNQLAHNYNGYVYRKWELAATGQDAAMQCKNEGNKNLPHEFPPTYRIPISTWGNKCAVGCNAHISSSGLFMGHFSNSAHTYIRMNRWAAPNNCLSWVDIQSTDMEAWAGENISGGLDGSMDWPRWSANSDKWICVNIGPRISMNSNGGNQVLVNWRDKQAIKVTQNTLYDDRPDLDTVVYWNDAGDFWINHGCLNVYEDTLGNLIDPTTGQEMSECVSVEARESNVKPQAPRSVSLHQGRMHFGQGRHVVRMFDCTGRLIYSEQVLLESWEIPQGLRKSGMVMLQVVTHRANGATEERTARLTL